VFSLCLLVCIQSQSNPPISGGFEREFQIRCRESTVLIRGQRQNEKKQGSGVVIGKKSLTYFALTAYHVVKDIGSFELDCYSEKTWPQPKVSKVSAIVDLFDESVDLAVLKFELPVGIEIPVARLAKFDTDFRRVRFPVLSVGCDNGRPPSCEEDVTTGKKLVFKENNPVAFFWETEKASIPGRSGGPLFDSRGSMIGICSARQSNMSYYVHIDEIRRMLKNGKFDWLSNSETDIK
jgi:S1-C subfamily serine protease